MQYTKCEYLTAIEVTGRDALSFLQGQLTCDVSKVNHEHSSLAAHCNIKGRMVSFGILCKIDESYFFIVPTTLSEKSLKQLKKYQLFSKITLTINHFYHFYGIELTTKSAIPWPEKEYTFLDDDIEKRHPIIPSHIHINARQNCDKSSAMKIMKVPGHNRAFIITTQAITFIHATEQPESWWQTSELKNGIPILSPETSGEFLPHDINLPQLGGVSFQKGCFLGQEIIARMEYLGKLKKKIRFQRSKTPPSENKIVTCIQYQNQYYSLVLD